MNKSEKPTTSVHTRAILVTVMLTSFFAPFMGNSVNLAVPAMAQQFQSSAALSTWIINAYMLSMVAFSVPLGRLSDLIGHRRVFLCGLAAFALTSVAVTFSWDMTSLIALRLLQGAAGAMVFSSNVPILLAAYPPQRRGRVLGYNVTGVYTGLALGPVVGGLLTRYFGWASIFWVPAVCLALLFFFALGAVPRERSRRSAGQATDAAGAAPGVSPLQRLDLMGCILLIAAISCLTCGLSTFDYGYVPKLLLVAAAILFVVFFLWELRQEQPVLQVRFFLKNRNFTFSNLAALLNYGATNGLIYLMSIHLQTVQGFDSAGAGLVLICQPVCMALLSPLAGRLSDRHSPFVLATVGMSICCVAVVVFAFIQVSTPLWLIIAGLLVMGVGIGIFSSPNTNAVMSEVSPENNGVASSLLNTMRSLGQSTNMAVITMISTIQLGGASFQAAGAGQLVSVEHTCFIVFICFSVVAIFLSLQRKPKPEEG